jgi:hypothetical protein
MFIVFGLTRLGLERTIYEALEASTLTVTPPMRYPMYLVMRNKDTCMYVSIVCQHTSRELEMFIAEIRLHV